MVENEIIINSLEDIDKAAAEFLERTKPYRVIAFYAPMGAGKTTFTSALCRCLSVKDDVCSPTFTIVNEYMTSTGELIYHFDLYRIDKLTEALDLGLDDYFYSGSLCLIEWPEKIEELLPEDCLKVSIDVEPDGRRRIHWIAQ